MIARQEALTVGDIALHAAEKNVHWLSLGDLILDTTAHVATGKEVDGKVGAGREKVRKRKKESEDEDGKDEGEITMFKSVGCAVQDISTAEYVFQRAKEMGLGTRVEM